MELPFFGRENELDRLNRAWEGRGAVMLALSGRPRAGKTALLAEWMRRGSRRALYWQAEPSSPAVLLRSFSQAVYAFAFPGVPIPPDFTFPTWEAAWEQIASLTQPGRLAVLLDEFPTLAASDPSVPARLADQWKEKLRRHRLVVVAAGRQGSPMRRLFTGADAPLKFAELLELEPLPFGLARAAFPRFTPAERVNLWAVLGGIPGYWRRFDGSRSLTENIHAALLGPDARMVEEARLLLSGAVSEEHNYAAILGAMAGGARTPRAIAAATGLPNMHIPKYLGVLGEAGFTARRVPVNEQEPSRSGEHHLTDAYLRFYYRFLAGRQGLLALGGQEQVAGEILRGLRGFAAFAWEELCQAWLRSAELPFPLQETGFAKRGALRVGAAGIHRAEGVMALGVCDWGLRPAGPGELRALAAGGAGELVPRQGQWRVLLLGFSGPGWNAEARALAEEINRGGVGGANWSAVGLRLVDLDELEEDLAARPSAAPAAAADAG